MIQLPKWILSNKFPSFYDSESQTAIEMVSRVYGAMNEMIEEFNSFISKIEKHVTDYESLNDEEREVYEVALRQEFQDFIDTVALKVMSQDQKFNDADSYMRSEIQKIASMFIQKAINEQLDIYNGKMLSNLDMSNFIIENLGNAIDDGDALSMGFAKTLFAPSGFGLGTYNPKYVDNWDQATKTGFYYSSNNSPDGEEWYGLTIARDGSLFTQLVFRTYGLVTLFCIRKHNTAWQEWNWFNPPMIPNVEYRTVELFNSKVVYVQNVQMGYLPNNSSKSINVNATGYTHLVRIESIRHNDSAGVDADVLDTNGIAHWVSKKDFGFAFGVSTEHDASNDYAFFKCFYIKD